MARHQVENYPLVAKAKDEWRTAVHTYGNAARDAKLKVELLKAAERAQKRDRRTLKRLDRRAALQKASFKDKLDATDWRAIIDKAESRLDTLRQEARTALQAKRATRKRANQLRKQLHKVRAKVRADIDRDIRSKKQ